MRAEYETHLSLNFFLLCFPHIPFPQYHAPSFICIYMLYAESLHLGSYMEKRGIHSTIASFYIEHNSLSICFIESAFNTLRYNLAQHSSQPMHTQAQKKETHNRRQCEGPAPNDPPSTLRETAGGDQ